MSYKINKLFYILILLVSFFAILSALFIEYVLSIQPCKLCSYQRIPYIFSIMICFFGFFFPKNKIWIYFLIVTFIFSILISGYHVGIENNIFTESSGCTNNSLNIIDKTELLQSLNNLLPSCKDVNFKILGLSLATINFLLSIALIGIIMKYFNNEKNR